MGGAGRGIKLSRPINEGQKVGMEYKHPPRPDNAGELLPSEARALFKRNGYYGPTSGFCVGFVQANLIILSDEQAEDFHVFCQKNSGPLPLIYKSKTGEHSAPPLAEDSDVRFDLPRYKVFRNGQLVDDVLDLGGFEQNWEDKVTFYFGCSFTFEDRLRASGIRMRNMDKGLNVSMYRTSISLNQAGSFGGNMAVSMRSISKEKLKQVFLLTAEYPSCHGAPVHIGSPARIGIGDIASPDWGDTTCAGEGEVPVFWACGVTTMEVVKKAAPPLAFTHYPGSMFITDQPAQPVPMAADVEVVEVVQQPFFASVLESNLLDLFSKIEEVILDDPGKRGVSHLFQKSDLLKSVLLLSHADKVAVTTGFPVREDQEVKEETDGLPGAISICQALLSLDKQVSLLCDDSVLRLYQSCVDHVTSLRALKSTIAVLPYSEALRLVSKSNDPPWNVLVAIERAGRNKHGNHCSMTGRTVAVDPMDDLFITLGSHPLVNTIGIGDGGNELGMGKVYDSVVQHIPNGEVIACKTSCDCVIAAGVSNWAGLAVALGLYVVARSPAHWRYRNYALDADSPPDWDLDAFVSTDEQVTSLLGCMNKLGFSDGVTGSKDLSVDGLPVQTHLQKRKQLVDLLDI